MCIAFFGVGLAPGVCFLLAFNRDEYILRPTEPTHFWPDQPHILAGRDVAHKGTWLGISSAGRVAFLTNLRAKDPVPDDPAVATHTSRGALTTSFLSTPKHPLNFLQDLDGSRFLGFNLVCGDVCAAGGPCLAYVNNGARSHTSTPHAPSPAGEAGCSSSEQEDARAGVPVQLQPGKLYGLSNGVLGEWPKVETGLLLGQQLLAPLQRAGSSAAAGVQQEEQTAHELPWDAIFAQLLGDTTRWEHRLAPDGVETSPPGPYPCLNGCSPISRQGPGNTASPNGHEAQQPDAQLPSHQHKQHPHPRHQQQTEHQHAHHLHHQPPQHFPSNLNADNHLEFVASARFIPPVPSNYGPYGTRSQIVLAVREDGTAELRERYLDTEAMGQEVAAQLGQPGGPAPVWASTVHSFTLTQMPSVVHAP